MRPEALFVAAVPLRTFSPLVKASEVSAPTEQATGFAKTTACHLNILERVWQGATGRTVLLEDLPGNSFVLKNM
jgi:hypothetical protein